MLCLTMSQYIDVSGRRECKHLPDAIHDSNDLTMTFLVSVNYNERII